MSGLLAIVCGVGGAAQTMPQILSYSSTGTWSGYTPYLEITDASCSNTTSQKTISVTASGGGLQYQWEGTSAVYHQSPSGGACSTSTSNGYVTDIANKGGGAPYWTDTSTSVLRLSAGAPIASYGSGFYRYITYVRCKVWNGVGTAYTPWILLYWRYCEQQTGYTGFNCDPCPYDCNCDCGWHTNCCCYDSNGDGVTCCDANDGDVYACCDRPDQCGEDYSCINCQTCYDYCSTCSNRNPGDSCYCAYYEPTYELTNSGYPASCNY